MMTWRALCSPLLLAPFAAATSQAAPPPRLVEVWYREVFEGSTAAAARDYQSLYLSPAPGALTPEQRSRAALRAGLCFERLGQSTSARSAFLAACQEVPGNPPAPRPTREAAFLGLRRLGPQGDALGSKPPLEVLAADDGAVAAAAAEAQAALRRTIQGRTAAAAALERQLQGLAEARSQRQAILARLEALGVVLSFSDASVPGGDAGRTVEQTLRSAQPQETELSRLLAVLSARFQERAVTALQARSAASAAVELRCLAAIREAARGLGSSPPQWSWLEALCTLQSSDVAGTLADRRAVEERWRSVTALRRELSLWLAASREALKNGPQHKALAPLERLRDELDWTAPVWLEDQEILAMRDEARRRALLLLRGPAETEAAIRLWREASEAVERLVVKATAYIRGVVEESRFAVPATVSGRREAVAACGQEVDRLLALAQEAVQRGDAAGGRQPLREAGWILARVPGADAGRERRQSLELLNMRMTLPPQLDLEGDEP